MALSHCWGGAIPTSTVLASLQARMDVLPVDLLPRDFRDAIDVARALGIRYPWVDSLCIVQDSHNDWRAEAGRMANVYAGATVVISALDATASSVGFVNTRTERVPFAALTDDYAVQKRFSHTREFFRTCLLSNRAWRLREQLLAPCVLHFGREKMYCECASYFACESGDTVTGHTAFMFGMLRPAWRTEWSEDLWNLWYRLLEEYSWRNSTVSTDKLPAPAGVVARLKSRKIVDSGGLALPWTPTYVAGLGFEDMARGLL